MQAIFIFISPYFLTFNVFIFNEIQVSARYSVVSTRMTALTLFLAFCLLSVAQGKILGSRTATNFPTDWEIVGEPCPFGTNVNFIVALKQVWLAYSIFLSSYLLA